MKKFVFCCIVAASTIAHLNAWANDPQKKKPTAHDALQFISDALRKNSVISHVFFHVHPSAMEGEPGTLELQHETWQINDIAASPDSCSIQYRVESQSDKLMRLVMSAIEYEVVAPWTQMMGVIKAQGQPETYAVKLQVKDQQEEPVLEFSDASTARRVAKAINYASELCKKQVAGVKTEEAPY